MNQHIVGVVGCAFVMVVSLAIIQHQEKEIVEMERCQVLSHSAEGLRHLRLVMLEELATSEGGDDWLRAQIEWADHEAEVTQRLAGCG